jgi:hypothetical protein
MVYDIMSGSSAIRQSKTRSCEALPQSTEWQRIGNQIDAAMIFAGAYFVNVL